jgi:hypothetical protein
LANVTQNSRQLLIFQISTVVFAVGNVVPLQLTKSVLLAECLTKSNNEPFVAPIVDEDPLTLNKLANHHDYEHDEASFCNQLLLVFDQLYTYGTTKIAGCVS